MRRRISATCGRCAACANSHSGSNAPCWPGALWNKRFNKPVANRPFRQRNRSLGKLEKTPNSESFREQVAQRRISSAESAFFHWTLALDVRRPGAAEPIHGLSVCCDFSSTALPADYGIEVPLSCLMIAVSAALMLPFAFTSDRKLVPLTD